MSTDITQSAEDASIGNIHTTAADVRRVWDVITGLADRQVRMPAVRPPALMPYSPVRSNDMRRAQ